MSSGWFRAILPKSALRVEEEAWNAYPYTKTRYRCPFVEKFLLEIETRYRSDCCEEDNIFGLKKSEIAQREVGGCTCLACFIFLWGWISACCGLGFESEGLHRSCILYMYLKPELVLGYGGR